MSNVGPTAFAGCISWIYASGSIYYVVTGRTGTVAGDLVALAVAVTFLFYGFVCAICVARWESK